MSTTTATRLVNVYGLARRHNALGAYYEIASGADGIPERMLNIVRESRGTYCGILIVDVNTGERWTVAA